MCKLLNLTKISRSFLGGVFLIFPTLLWSYEAPESHYRTVENQYYRLTGEWQPGGIIIGTLLDSSVTALRLGEHDIAIADTGQFVFGFDRNSPLKTAIGYLVGNQWHQHQFSLAKREYRIQRIDGLDNSKVTVDPKHLKRIREESAQISKARRAGHDYLYFTQPFVLPLKGIVTGVYGSQRVLNGKPRRPHYGIDIAAPEGTLVRAPADAVVSLAHDDMFFAGKTLVMDHGHGLMSAFLHLQKILVEAGDKVEQGQVVAAVGATGRVTGAHLDWRMNWFTHYVDPVLMLGVPQRNALFSAP